MTSAAFGMDNDIPDWTEDFDFGAFLNFPPDNADQGDMFGEQGQQANPPYYTAQPMTLGGLLATTLTQPQSRVWPIALPPHPFDHTGSLEGADGGCHFEPLPVSPGSVYPTFTDHQNTALNEHDRCSKVGMPEPGMIQEFPRPKHLVGSSIVNALTSSSSHECACIACLSVGALKDWPDQGMSCRFPDCSYFTENHSDHILHERDHFQKAGNAAFRCVEQVYSFSSKRWPDLVRHYTVKHCTSPKKFQYPCPVLWCKYSGSNGFARKDKLKSHYKNIHEGKPGPVKAGRVIKPATLKP